MARKVGRHSRSADASLPATAGEPAAPSPNAVAKGLMLQIRPDSTPAGAEGVGSGDQARAADREAGRPNHAEPVAQLVQQVFLMPGSEFRQVVMFSALEAHPGAAALCGQVAEALAAKVDGGVCLVDADLRQPTLHHYFGVSEGSGLASALNGVEPMPSYVQVRDNLWLVPAGSPSADPGVQFASDRTRRVLDELRHQFKYVLVHAAPIGERSESLVFSRWTDGVVLIIQANRTLQSTARRVRDSLATARVPLLAVALTHDRRLSGP